MRHITLKRLHAREIGTLNPRKFLAIEAGKASANFEPWKHYRFPKLHKGTITCLDVDGVYGQLLLASSEDGIIRLHNIHHPFKENTSKYDRLPEKFRTSPLKFLHETVQCVQWYPRGISLFISSGFDCRIKMWDVNNMRTNQTLNPCGGMKHRLFQFDLSKVSRSPTVAVALSSGEVPLIDLRLGKTAHRLRGHHSFVLVCKWSSVDENILSSAGADSIIRLWDIRRTQKPMCQLYMDPVSSTTQRPSNSSVGVSTSHDGMINALHFTSDGKRLLSFGKDNTVRMWDVYNGGKPLELNCGKMENTTLRPIQLATTRLSSPPHLFVPTGKLINVINLNTGLVVNSMKNHFDHVLAMAYSPLYEELYSSGKDRDITMWRQGTGIRDRIKSQFCEVVDGCSSVNRVNPAS